MRDRGRLVKRVSGSWLVIDVAVRAWWPVRQSLRRTPWRILGGESAQVLRAAVRVKYRAERDERVLERAVVDVHAAPLRLHEACLAQLGNMMTYGRFGQP